jgi:hypothetical protein
MSPMSYQFFKGYGQEKQATAKQSDIWEILGTMETY